MKSVAIIIICALTMFSCKQKVTPEVLEETNEQTTVETTIVEEPPVNAEINLNQMFSHFEIKKIPVIDTTNYRNAIESEFLSKDQVIAVSLLKIYPNFFKETHNYKAKPNYRILLSKDYHSLVYTIFKGENELESVLVTYAKDWNIIDHLVVAYDEIAEGWSQKKGVIKKDRVTITDILWLEEKQETTTSYSIMHSGKINPLTTKN